MRYKPVKQRAAAFSLIEVTLALLVVSIGILAVMGLFPMGLDQSAHAEEDTRMALFADETLNSLRAYARDDWDGLAGKQWPAAVWQVFESLLLGRCTKDIRTNIYISGKESNALRYRLMLSTNYEIKAATLWVWSGEFGATGAPHLFYTEFYK